MLQQRTLKSLTKAVGVGLHSGQRVELTLRPAQPDTGIVFRRVDLPDARWTSRCRAEAVTDTRLASTISSGGAKVHTVEHLMSACAGLGLDNLYVDITAEEVPILDGSSASFVFLLQSAGIELQKAPRRFIRVLQPVEVREGRGRQPQVGAAGAVPRLQAELRDRLRPPRGRFHRPARRVRPEHGLLLPATSRGPAPSASPRTWR